MPSRLLRVLVDDTNAVPEFKAARSAIEQTIRAAGTKIIEVDADILFGQLASVYSLLTESLSQLPTTPDTFTLKSVNFTLAIDSTGTVSLVSAVSGATKSQLGLTFTLENKQTR